MKYGIHAAFSVSVTALTLASLSSACGGSTKPAESPEGATEEPAANGDAKDTTTAPSPAKTSSDPAENDAPSSATACVGLEMELVDALSKAACEVPNPKPDEKLLETKGMLDVKAVAASPKVSAGGTIDVTVMFTNKAKGVLPLNFTVNPLPRFEVETYDAKGRRVDMPAGDHPSWPTTHDSSEPEPKTAQVKLAENGTGRVHLKWSATKMKWAPEKARGAASGSPYPRVAAGQLPKGKYTIRVVTPLIGVFEGAEHEISAPKFEIEVGK
jgi:hypothetical protein